MSALDSFDRISVEDYLEGEHEAEFKHEYVYGFVYAMAGSSPVHNIIANNIVRAFGNALEDRPCVVYTSDMKVRADEASFYYPDVMIVCENDMQSYYQEKPCVIVEVLSPSTKRKDLHEKAFTYKQMTSLQLYLIVDSQTRQVFGHHRTENGWQELAYETGVDIPIPCADMQLSYKQIYAKTDLAL